jgi:hypothetical protein
MPNFMFAYHGGSRPESEDEVATVMAAWGAWMGANKEALADPGNPVGMSKTVTAGGVEDNGGANPLSGYAIISADTMDDAIAVAKGCPILLSGGTVEVAEIHEVQM